MVEVIETTPPPAAGTSKEDLLALWTIERSRILKERYAATRRAEEEGRDIFFLTDPPPPEPPSYWRSNDGETRVEPLTEPPEVDPSPGTIKLHWPFGRRNAAPDGPTVEEIFARGRP